MSQSDLMVAIARMEERQIAALSRGERMEKLLDTQATQLTDLNTRVSRLQGSAGVFGSVAGAVFGGIVSFFVKAHS